MNQFYLVCFCSQISPSKFKSDQEKEKEKQSRRDRLPLLCSLLNLFVGFVFNLSVSACLVDAHFERVEYLIFHTFTQFAEYSNWIWMWFFEEK